MYRTSIRPVISAPRTIRTMYSPIKTPKRVIPPRADWNTGLVETSYFVGKGVTLFVSFYTFLQWLYYRKLRQEKEKDQ